jgi:hypothetical protein
MRGRILTAAATILLFPAAARAEAPRPTELWDLQGSTTSSYYDSREATASLYAVLWDGNDPSAATFEDATIPGAPRDPWQVLRIPAHNGAAVGDSAGTNAETWTVAALLSIDDVEGPGGIVNTGSSYGNEDDDKGVWIEGGHLELRGGTAVPVASTGIEPDRWYQLVLTWDGSMGRLYVDGEPELTWTGCCSTYGPKFFKGDYVWTDGAWKPEYVGGRLARVRMWDSALPAAEVAGLPWLDTSPPHAALRVPADGGVGGPRPLFMGGALDDDLSRWPQVTLRVRRPDGSIVGEMKPSVGWNITPADWFDYWPGYYPDLEHGVRYTVDTIARDYAGNEATSTSSFTVDGRYPGRLKLLSDPTPETTDPTPFVSGTVERQQADRPFVQYDIGVPAGQGWLGVAHADLQIADDGAFAGEIPEPLPPGDYILRVGHLDKHHEFAEVTKPLRIVAPPSPLAPPPALPRSSPAPDTTATALQRSAVRTLGREGIAGLLRDGARIAFTAPRPGVASVRLIRGSRSLATGRRQARRAGRARLTLRLTKAGRRVLRRQRRLRVVVRTAFSSDAGASSRTARVTLRR